MDLKTTLLDLEIRFLYAAPPGELEVASRLMFLIEKMWWMYEDFYRSKNPDLPKTFLKKFGQLVFEHCTLFSSAENDFDRLFEGFKKYRAQIPVYGCILLSSDLSHIVLCKAYGTKTWMFPRGKQDEQESEMECAIRETYEETGFNAKDYVLTNESSIEKHFDGKKVKMFLVKDVPRDYNFLTQTNYEISKVQFWSIDKLPKRTFAVKNFIGVLKKMIKQLISRKLADAQRDAKLKKKQTATNVKSASEVALLSLVNGKKDLDTSKRGKEKKKDTNVEDVPSGQHPIKILSRHDGSKDKERKRLNGQTSLFIVDVRKVMAAWDAAAGS